MLQYLKQCISISNPPSVFLSKFNKTMLILLDRLLDIETQDKHINLLNVPGV